MSTLFLVFSICTISNSISSLRQRYDYQFIDEETKVQVSYITKGHTDGVRSNDKSITYNITIPQKVNRNSSKKNTTVASKRKCNL